MPRKRGRGKSTNSIKATGGRKQKMQITTFQLRNTLPKDNDNTHQKQWKIRNYKTTLQIELNNLKQLFGDKNYKQKFRN